jgi:organic hydroperoxide reductase OsmC/OhrA
VQLEVALPALDRVEAEKLVEQAHQVCPYSNATRGNVEVTLSVA